MAVELTTIGIAAGGIAAVSAARAAHNWYRDRQLRKDFRRVEAAREAVAREQENIKLSTHVSTPLARSLTKIERDLADAQMKNPRRFARVARKAGWDEGKHPRVPAGSAQGGEWTEK